MSTDSTPTTEAPEPVKKTRIEKIAGPALYVGCFVIWPATSLATAYLGYKCVDMQTAAEVAKVAIEKGIINQ